MNGGRIAGSAPVLPPVHQEVRIEKYSGVSLMQMTVAAMEKKPRPMKKKKILKIVIAKTGNRKTDLL